MSSSTAGPRRLGALVVALILSVTGVVVGSSVAEAQTSICTAWTVADVAACDTSGYAAEMHTMHWGMYAGHNCTNYVAYRLGENGVKQPSYRLGNADTWAPRAKANGVLVDSRPAVGAVGAWPGRRHVLYVEEVGNGYLIVSEDAWGGSYRKLKVYPGDNSYPTQFIHFKDLSAPSAPVLSDGDFIRAVGNPAVYRMAGGAPMYVSSWAAVGGQAPVISVSAKQFAGLQTYPTDGSFIRAKSSNRVYRIAGSAPVWVTSWPAIGGPFPAVVVDDKVVANAGGTGRWARLRSTPSNRFIEGKLTGRAFRIIDGRALYVSSWTPYGGAQPMIQVDDKAIDGCDHLNCTPFGLFDGAVGGVEVVTVKGWAIDPNTTGSLSAEVLIDGAKVATVKASKVRAGLGSTYNYGDTFGFDAVVPAAAGVHEVCVTAINVGRGANTPLGCVQATVTAKPIVTVGSATVVTAPASGAAFGSTQTVTATVTAKGATPVGAVQFALDGAVLATVKVAAGKAIATIPATTASGAHKLIATFLSSNTKAVTGSKSSVATVTVTKALSTATIKTSATSQKVGATAGIIATASIVFGAQRPAAGSVTFLLDGVAVATVTLSSAGTAAYTLPTTTPVGTKKLSVSYAGDTNVSAVKSAATSLTVTAK